MNINKILKNYDAEDKEAFKTDFKLWLKYLNKTFGWDISNITLKNVKVVKVDSKTKEVIKDKFVFGIFEDAECTKLIKEI